jgi:hypothetical protein
MSDDEEEEEKQDPDPVEGRCSGRQGRTQPDQAAT